VFHSARIPSTVSNIEVPRDLVVGLFGIGESSRFKVLVSTIRKFAVHHPSQAISTVIWDGLHSSNRVVDGIIQSLNQLDQQVVV